jgi:ligand-binding sensor domain-containing protein
MRLDASGHFAPMDAITRNMVINPNAMLSTPTHIVAGSLGQGLWSYARASQRWTQITSGLPSLNVTAFAARDGVLYVGTQNGLVRITESKLPQ